LFLPASALKAVRRAAAEQLLQLQQQHGIDAGLAATPILPGLLAEAQGRKPTAAAAAAGVVDAGEQRAASGASASTSGRSSDSSSSSSRQMPSSSAAEPVLRVLCRTPQQVEAALRVPWLTEIILDFLEVHGLKEAVAAVQAGGKRAVAALPRIFKPEEERLLNFYLRLGADALLIRSTGALHQLQQLGGPGSVVQGLQPWSKSSSSSSNTSAHDDGDKAVAGSDPTATSTTTSNSSSSQAKQHQGGAVRVPALEGDFSLNVANLLSADLLLNSSLSRLAPTHDLNGRQLVELGCSLSGGGRSDALEAIVHQHLPIFHTEHCVFCRCVLRKHWREKGQCRGQEGLNRGSPAAANEHSRPCFCVECKGRRGCCCKPVSATRRLLGQPWVHAGIGCLVDNPLSCHPMSSCSNDMYSFQCPCCVVQVPERGQQLQGLRAPL
jgi:hypothetical protein